MPEKLEKINNDLSNGLSSAVTGLLGQNTKITYVSCTIEQAPNIKSLFSSGEIAVCTLKNTLGASTSAFLLIGEKNAAVMADLMIGQDGQNAPSKMSELHVSAFSEVVGQIFTSFSEVLAIHNVKNSWEVEKTTIDNSVAVEELFKTSYARLMIFSVLNIEIGNISSGPFLLCYPSGILRQINKQNEHERNFTDISENLEVGKIKSSISSQKGESSMQQLGSDFVGTDRPIGGNINLLLDVPLKLTVELGRTSKLVKEILALAPGSVVELDKLAGEAVDVLVNEKLIAKGEVVVIDENFGVRITEILNPEERLTAIHV